MRIMKTGGEYVFAELCNTIRIHGWLQLCIPLKSSYEVHTQCLACLSSGWSKLACLPVGMMLHINFSDNDKNTLRRWIHL